VKRDSWTAQAWLMGAFCGSGRPHDRLGFIVDRTVLENKCALTIRHSIDRLSNQFEQSKDSNMPKGQRNSKEVKKPKKDGAPSKPMSPDAVSPTKVTVVPERSKKK
jgi:hypothetical protein